MGQMKEIAMMRDENGSAHPVPAHVDALARQEVTAPVKIPYVGKELPDGRIVGADLSIPDFCRIPKEQRGFNDTKAVEMGKALAAEKAKLPVPPPSDGRLAKAIDEQKAAKTAARIGSLKAAKAKLVPHDKPLEGKAALDAIKNAQTKVTAAETKKSAKAVKIASKRSGKAADAPKTEKSAKAAPKAKDAPAAKREGTKTNLVRSLLVRENGCTTADVLAATGWTAVSMPAMAKTCGLTLRKEKAKGGNTRYYGT